MEVLVGIAVIVILYLVVNGKRNSDPLNRKCAAEICEYLTTREEFDPLEICEIFETHARYQKQAKHIVSMVPALLINAGYPKDAAMAIVPLLQLAAFSLPK